MPINETNGGGDEENPPSSSSSSPHRRHKRSNTGMDPFLVVCRCFSVVTSLTAILCISVNVVTAIRSFKNLSDIFDVVFRCYAILLAVFVIITETEWSFLFKHCGVLEYWAGRGMLQIFVAVMTRAYTEVNKKRKDLLLLQEISSYLLLACGLIYILCGVLCLGFLKRARQGKEVSRGQAAKDLEELERRKEELQALLLLENAR
ncbi:hypothetical protein ACHQM5_023685 [Ranunculus cassubicifolius]